MTPKSVSRGKHFKEDASALAPSTSMPQNLQLADFVEDSRNGLDAFISDFVVR